MRKPRFDEKTHRVHDYRHLIARWRQVARAAGLKLKAFARTGKYPVYCLHTKDSSPGGLYVSAGIHGDEPAGAEALCLWAETHLPTLVRLQRSLPLLILPCLNPWGLVNNRRANEQDVDLNRIFDRTDVAPVGELRALLEGRSFDLALCLHEDYDAQGAYIYEIHAQRPDWGRALLGAVREAGLPIDPRRTIDGRPFERGVMLRRGNLQRIPLHPEAIYLYLHHCPHVFTFETPSEFDLPRRVQAQVLLIEECVRRLLRQQARLRP